MDNDGWLPDIDLVQVPGYAGRRFGRPGEIPWFARLYPSYIPDLAVLSCPDDPFRFRMQKVRNAMTPESAADYADSSSYGLNGFILSYSTGYLADLDRKQPSRPLDTILAADIGPDSVPHVDPSTIESPTPFRNFSVIRWDDGYDPYEPDLEFPWVTARHGRCINVLTLGGGVREAVTEDLMRNPIHGYYANCSAGGCTLCNEFHLPHYNFARDRLFWWTGPLPAE